MKQAFEGWEAVAGRLRDRAADEAGKVDSSGEAGAFLNAGQRASLDALASRLPRNGVVIADEVGMGKTRIAVALARCVIESGGRVAILVPPGLGYQWQSELQTGGVDSPSILRGLGGYFEPWRDESAAKGLLPWFERDVVLLSHAFVNWRLGEGSYPWRWALLPHVYAAWRMRSGGRSPRNYEHWVSTQTYSLDAVVRRVAESVVGGIPPSGKHPAARLSNDLMEAVSWPQPLEPGEYAREGTLREWLERTVGLGLGVFDLVVIDEAHKSRGSQSGLSRLLERVVISADEARRLGMTATPVELDVDQWSSTLSRIGLSEERRRALEQPIARYAESIWRVRHAWLASDGACEQFSSSAADFQAALSPYLLRRDKRQDPAVQKFHEVSGRPPEEYRDVARDIRITGAELSLPWKRAVCASEALSLVTSRADDSAAQRLRLTLGNGHGIAAVIDHVHHDPKRDSLGAEDESVAAATDGEAPAAESLPESKRAQRACWWRGVLETAFAHGEDALFDHPAILAAVKTIESATDKGEKVLVFGRYTKPLPALVSLLNAREMLRRLDRGQPWPQAKVAGSRIAGAESGEWPAVRAAYRHLAGESGWDNALDEGALENKLQAQYERFDAQRVRFRDHLTRLLEQGIEDLTVSEKTQECDQVTAIVDALRRAHTRDDITLVARALSSLILHSEDLDGTELPQPSMVAQAFADIVRSASDKDDPDPDQNGDGDIDETEADELWSRLKARLSDEYNRPEGGFARLMYGGTPQASRRLLQLAFNRQASFPRVLVAQSMVGREGLNLHEACRIVVILHPEWNPGVIEQQIGRVDRVGSRWCKDLEQAILEDRQGARLPRIEVRPVVFEGTYDEYNWQVLRQRWDDLRAQLYGVVIPPRLAKGDPVRAEQINTAAPDFSPR